MTFEDFLTAVGSVRRALTFYQTREHPVDWKMVQNMFALQYAPLETNAWDHRVMLSLLHKYLHRGILNSRHEVLPGLSLVPLPGRAGMQMSLVVKSSRANANKGRIECLGLHRATARIAKRWFQPH